MLKYPPLDGTSRKKLFRNLTIFASYPMYSDPLRKMVMPVKIFGARCTMLRHEEKYFEIWQFCIVSYVFRPVKNDGDASQNLRGHMYDASSRKKIFQNLTFFASYPMYFDPLRTMVMPVKIFGARCTMLPREKFYFELWQFFHCIPW